MPSKQNSPGGKGNIARQYKKVQRPSQPSRQEASPAKAKELKNKVTKPMRRQRNYVSKG